MSPATSPAAPAEAMQWWRTRRPRPRRMRPPHRAPRAHRQLPEPLAPTPAPGPQHRSTSSAYLSPDSDVVAHLVLAHQTQMHNLITLTNFKTRLALYAQAETTLDSAVPSANAPPDASLPRGHPPPIRTPRRATPPLSAVRQRAPPLAPAPGARVGASSAFAKEFAARGPRDSKGRSLRDLDLTTRIFRYPCSYLVYSDSFAALPGAS